MNSDNVSSSVLYFVVANYKFEDERFCNSVPILITADLAKAVQAARSAETLGYQLADEYGLKEIGVWSLSPETECALETLQYAGAPPKGYPNILSIARSRGKTFEAWTDQEIRKLFEH